MAGWAAAAAIGGALISGQGAAAANQQSAVQSKRMYKHRYQWTVQDLKAAGLNPMLAVQNGAPVPQSPQVSNVGEAAVRGASAGFSAAQAFKLQKEQLANIQSDTELKKASAAAQVAAAQESQQRAAATMMSNTQVGYDLEYAEGTAREKYKSLAAATRVMQNNVQSTAEDVLIKKQERVQREDLLPLLLEYQRYMNQATKLGMSEKRADAEFWDTLPEAKYGGIVKMLMQLIKER